MKIQVSPLYKKISIPDIKSFIENNCFDNDKILYIQLSQLNEVVDTILNDLILDIIYEGFGEPFIILKDKTENRILYLSIMHKPSHKVYDYKKEVLYKINFNKTHDDSFSELDIPNVPSPNTIFITAITNGEEYYTLELSIYKKEEKK